LARSKRPNQPWKRLWTWFLDFVSAVPGSLKNHLNVQELSRVTVAAISAGGGVFSILQAISAHLGTIFPSATDAAVAAVVLTMILEARRRLGHGGEPIPPARRPGRAGV
jgi:hypothetical protein